MKKIFFIPIISALLFLTGCEDVIDVDLDTAPPRLVIEASINWIKDTPGNEQFIRLTTTTSYFSQEIPAVTDAIVTITNSEGTVFTFEQNEIPGIYVCTNFVTELNETYTLSIVYEGEIYTSTERLLATPVVKRIEQREEAGVLGEETEFKFFFDDIENETNFYFIGFSDTYRAFPDYAVLEDRFFENNEMFGLYFSEKLKPGDTLTYTMSGISQQYFNYMNILLAQTGNSSGGPFSTPNSTVRGNIVNQTNFDNFALGYFRLSETVIEEYVVE